MTQRLDSFLSASARATPHAVALRERAEAETSYEALEALATTIARSLAAIGIGAGDRVGICRPKDALTVAAIFGILKAGAAYVPVDPKAPVPRSAGIFADCQVAAIFVDKAGAEAIEAELRADFQVTRSFDIAGMVCLKSKRGTETGPKDTAYILYTSGSTGKPKGVTHTHSTAFAFVDWCSRAFAPTPADVFSSHAPFHFDLSILDLYVPIRHGASVRIIDADEGKNPALLSELIEVDQISNWYSTPTILRAMVDFGGLEKRDLSSLKVICFAGEVFPTKHLKRLASLLPQVRYLNLFGPTETNVCTYFELSDPLGMADTETVPIGYAASSDQLRLVGSDGQEVAAGDEGELLVAGGSVMVGYWGDAARTNASFTELAGQRWYKTGDVVAARGDGALIYHGRRDRMIKRRGYRIELGEVEAAISCHPSVSEVAAVAVQDKVGETQIVVFCSRMTDAPLSQIALKQHAAKHLPIYMVPDLFQAIDAIPHTSTDKTDYQTLKGLANGLFAE